jgi:hypothetical protein
MTDNAPGSATMTDNADAHANNYGFIVGLREDVTPEEAAAIAAAVRLFRGVEFVQAAETDPDEQLSRERVNAEWRQRIVGLLDDEGV